METRAAKRKRFWFESENGIDRISDLPDVVLHQILFHLPIKTIAQTSVLSKRWRSLWISFPDLDFTSINTIGVYSTKVNPASTVKRLLTPPHSLSNKRLDFISQVLAIRDKHSDLRILRFRAPLSFSRLNGLIRLAVRQNVQELDVEVTTDDYFNFPRSVLTSESLRVFKLRSSYPGFRLPPPSVMKGGFRSLHTLSLSLVILYTQPSLSDLFTDASFPRLKKLNLDTCFGLKHLKVSCLVLEDLTLEKCFQLIGLDVSGARLKRLRVASCFDAKCGESWVKMNAPSLRSMVWEYNSITENSSLENLISAHEASIGFFVVGEDLSVTKIRSVSNLLSGLSRLHSLTLESECVEVLSSRNYIANVIHPFNHLKSLELQTGFNRDNVPSLAYLFKSSPTLHTLILKILNDYKIERRKWNKDLWDMPTSEEEQFWESQTHALKPLLNHLSVVKIHGFLECENEVSLAKFLLKHGKALQEMTLFSGHCNYRDSLRRQKIRSQMMGFSRASSNAKIQFL
ncbi:putative F-box/FBD/LRR-repeat protein [Hibiscus syriacus]|uniref:F-box/FBD/LRR-repeat protein n=1 Tax=Hibiscus syriacus TaxID=106335 RepID=A0A6A3A2G5_HIBSY|nr:putative F-box/FBD/LRR-repeat protein At4g03220 [Hibiscus syriacus]KAE8698474.1 putative F-box/FBD/LRR-repeat protein [Hibiscus syriacus]